jgi:hypothetical protein
LWLNSKDPVAYEKILAARAAANLAADMFNEDVNSEVHCSFSVRLMRKKRGLPQGAFFGGSDSEGEDVFMEVCSEVARRG